jgi:flagellar hook-associated protein 3 FlgL
MADSQASLVQLLDRRRMEVAGVSLDEEAMNLLRHQRAYEAAARLMTAMDQMLDKAHQRHRRGRAVEVGMRITGEMLTDTVLGNLSQTLHRLDEVQNELSSGKRIAHPSDDPRGVSAALSLRSAVATGETYLKTIDSSLSWLNVTEAALGSATELMQRARELAVQGSSDTLSATQVAGLAAEVDQLLNQMVTLGNATSSGQRLFGGLRTTTNPFTLNAGPPTTVTYNGDAGLMTREIDVGSTMSINVTGGGPFPSMMSALIQLRNDLQAGNTTGVRGDIATLDAAMESLLGARADVGGRVNRLESAQARQQQVQVRITKQLSNVEDTDYAEAITRFTVQENIDKSALAAGSRALQPSLFDYLR